MTNTLKLRGLILFASILNRLTSFSVNSACMLCLGQEKEPESLKRFKKH